MPIGKKYLGIDIGSLGIRAIEIENRKGRARLNNYAYVNFSEPVDLSLSVNDAKKIIIAAIKKIKKKAKFSTNRAFGVIPAYYSFNKIFNFKEGTPREQINQWVEKNVAAISFPEQNVSISWQEIGSNSGSNQINIFVSAVPSKLVSKYKTIFKKSSLKILSLETTYHSLVRSLVGYDNYPILVVDVGGVFTDMMLIDRGILYSSQSLKFGGEEATRTLASKMNIGREQAEQFKKDNNLFIFKKSENGSRRDYLGKHVQDLEVAAKNFLEEYFKNSNGKVIKKVVLTGGCSRDDDLLQLFERITGAKAFRGNPFGRIISEDSIKSFIDEISPNFSIAVGAVMKSLQY